VIALANQQDAVRFERAYECPPRDLMQPAQVAAVCESVDVERGIATYRSVEPCAQQWPLQECERC